VFIGGTCGTLTANGFPPEVLAELNLLGTVVGPGTICGAGT